MALKRWQWYTIQTLPVQHYKSLCCVPLLNQTPLHSFALNTPDSRSKVCSQMRPRLHTYVPGLLLLTLVPELVNFHVRVFVVTIWRVVHREIP